MWRYTQHAEAKRVSGGRLAAVGSTSTGDTAAAPMARLEVRAGVREDMRFPAGRSAQPHLGERMIPNESRVGETGMLGSMSGEMKRGQCGD